LCPSKKKKRRREKFFVDERKKKKEKQAAQRTFASWNPMTNEMRATISRSLRSIDGGGLTVFIATGVAMGPVAPSVLGRSWACLFS